MATRAEPAEQDRGLARVWGLVASGARPDTLEEAVCSEAIALTGARSAVLASAEGAGPDSLLALAAIQAGRAAQESGGHGIAALAAGIGPDGTGVRALVVRVARELHDETGQVLTAVALKLLALEEHVDDVGREQLAGARRSLAEATSALRDLALRLRPSGLEDHGLESAIERQADRLRVDPGIEVDVAIDIPTGLDEEAEIAVFRVVQEALTNIQRHSGARHASVLVSRLPGRVRVVIEDDGAGFDPAAGTDRLGMEGIRERVALLEGTATFESSPGSGTTVVVEIPG